MMKFDELMEVDSTEIGKEHTYRENVKNKRPWVDKYRPKKLDGIVYQDEIMKTYNQIIENLMHMHCKFCITL